MATVFGYDPYYLNLKVQRLRPIGEFWCECIFEKHSSAKASFNCVKGTLYCHHCKRSANLHQILEQTAGSVRKKIFVLPEQNETQNDWLHLVDLPLAIDNDYLINKRHLTNETIRKFNIKQHDSGIIIPLSENGKIVGMIERKYYGKTRYIFYGKVPLIFPEIVYDCNKPVFLTEGVFGVFNALQNDLQAYCIFGTYVTDAKLKLLTNYQLIAAFDNDEAGHNASISFLQKAPGNTAIYPGIEADETNWKNYQTTYRITDFMRENNV